MGNQWKFLVLIICFLRFCQVSRSVGFTIDNQLVIIANDCYTRIAIGSKLPDADIFFSVAVGSISECEDECSKQRNSCNAFAFGIGVKGNGTCALSTRTPKFEDLQSHADYDVYVRSQRSPQCEPDRLYKMGSGIMRQEKRNETRPVTRFGSGLWNPTMPSMLSSPRTMKSMMRNISDEPLYQQGYTPSFDDERRISDILKNRNPMPANNPFGTNNAKIDNPSIYSNRKSTFGQRIHSNPNQGRPDFSGSSFRNPFTDLNYVNFGPTTDSDFHSYKAVTVHNGPFELFSRPLFVYDTISKNQSPLNFGFWTDHDSTKHRNQEFFNNADKNQGIITRPKQNELITGNYDISKVSSPSSSSYNFETTSAKIANSDFKDTSKIWNSGLSTGFRDFGARITEKPKSCYRRLLSGKKSLELHVRRAVECDRIDDCHRACDYEKLFVCEGFNYRRYGHGTRGMCELTSIPFSRMDFHRDFIADPQCDYYEKDPNCAANAPETRPSWWNQPSRPTQLYGPPYSINRRPDTRPYAPDLHPSNEIPRPLDYDRRPLKEIPRPSDYDRRPTNEIPRPLDYDHRPVNHDRRPSTVYGHHTLYDDAFNRRGYPQDSFQDRYPSARPEDRFSYSGRFPPRRPIDDDFYNRNLPWATPPKYPNRRIGYGPAHDIGTNEVGSYLPDHRRDQNNWDSYGVYGGSYGYDTNYVGKFDVPKYYPKSQPKSPHPYENDHFYGEFYNYGGAFGYGDSYIPANQDTLYSGSGKVEECSVRAGAGFRLSRGVVRKTYLTPNLDQCESLCINEKNFICMSFSYRYNVAPTDPTDNCLLSNVSYKDLNFYNDLEPDRDYDIYAMIASRTCGTRRESSAHPPDECFWRVRSGYGMPTDVVKKSMTVDNLGDCQVECTIAQDFTCRSFAFKYRLDQGRSDVPINCYLSDWPSQDINPVNMPDMDGAELYERGSFGRGCEPYSVPFFNMERFNGKQSSQGDDVCYSGYNKPCKLTPYAVLLATYVNSEQDCRQKCSRMRQTDSIPCMSYSYKLTTHGKEENCLLSDVPIRDLRPGLDYIYDNNHVLFAWKDLDPYCVITGYSVDDDHVFGGPSPSRPLLPGPSRPDFTLGGTDYPGVRPESTYPDPRPFFMIPKPGGHHHGVRPFNPDKPDPVGSYRPEGGYGGHDDKFGYGNRPGGFDHGSNPDEHSIFRYYTVNGYPCKKGTKCERNKIAGFWVCETEGGDYGSWDYCCAPTHNCGFSQGYHYPWCYVGSSEEQWRPCSEKYFPYLPSPRPIRPPTIGDDRHDRPRDPGYYGRHWPITYLHREPPPNCTDSLASADNSGNRHSNETTPSTMETASTTIKSDENNTTIANRTRRRWLRVRKTTNDTRNNRHAIVMRKIDGQIAVNNVRNRDIQANRERAAKIERVSKPKSSEIFAALTVAPLAAKTNTIAGVLDGKNSDDDMIRVPLIASNN
ncbi:uncharacterized protein LOC109860143 isoform X1 [Pseudomyrmex gracilis]|uniref:uncharacterized protein LOC109860143 isoform X1 n=1 Tax=Pseudomyrmex gracilis TaxID=219809 RepID=UPI000995CFBA|nr:uncharacterized protein LOC109860143 isoform X1 [Pseudomyrmex gracilis]XP_020294618.1 uncharacterized protein LOC109860143 isoform X1 [Pseudomyrmex gracilis]